MWAFVTAHLSHLGNPFYGVLWTTLLCLGLWAIHRMQFGYWWRKPAS